MKCVNEVGEDQMLGPRLMQVHSDAVGAGGVHCLADELGRGNLLNWKVVETKAMFQLEMNGTYGRTSSS